MPHAKNQRSRHEVRGLDWSRFWSPASTRLLSDNRLLFPRSSFIGLTMVLREVTGRRYYYFATGDAACQFACQTTPAAEIPPRPAFSGTGVVRASPLRTQSFWLTGSPYWAYDSTRGQHCKVPVRQTDQLTPVTQPPYICGFSTGDPRSDISWIQQYHWVGSGWICPLGGYNFNSTDKTCTLIMPRRTRRRNARQSVAIRSWPVPDARLKRLR